MIIFFTTPQIVYFLNYNLAQLTLIALLYNFFFNFPDLLI